MLKVAIINSTCGFGSTGKITAKMYADVIREGHSCKVFYGVKTVEDGDPNPDFVYFGNKFCSFVDHAVSNLTGLSGALAFYPTWKLFRELDAFQPDVIWLYHIHGGFVHEYWLLDYAKKKAKWTLYSMADEYPLLGKCCYSYDCTKYQEQTGCHHCPQLRESPRSLIFDNSGYHFRKKQQAYAGFDNLTFLSAPYVVEKAKGSQLLKDKEFYTTDTHVDIAGVYYPRDPAAIRAELGIPEDRKVMIICAPLDVEYKGVKYFLEAARKCEGDGIVFVNVAYGGDPALCPSNYIPLPYVNDQNRLCELLSLADAYVCTSIADAQPNACLNALGCGTPVIGFNVSGVPYVAPNEFGTFVKPFDVDQLAEAIRNHPRKTPETVAACHAYALARFGFPEPDPNAPPQKTLLQTIEERIKKQEKENG